jgi:hypothetical protein
LVRQRAGKREVVALLEVFCAAAEIERERNNN